MEHKLKGVNYSMSSLSSINSEDDCSSSVVELSSCTIENKEIKQKQGSSIRKSGNSIFQCTYKCTVCDKMFTKKQYTRHIKTHSRKQGKFAHLKSKDGYSCKVCKLKFNGRYPTAQLKRHLITHSLTNLLGSGYPPFVNNKVISQLYNLDLKQTKTKQQRRPQSDNDEAPNQNEELKQPEPKFHNSIFDDIKEGSSNQNQLGSQQQQVINDEIKPQIGLNNYKNFKETIEQKSKLEGFLIESIEELIQSRPSLTYNHLSRHYIGNLKQDALYRDRVQRDFTMLINLKEHNNKQLDSITKVYFSPTYLLIWLKSYDFNLGDLLNLQHRRVVTWRCIVSAVIAIAKLHEQNVVHLYLKPQNIKINLDDTSYCTISNFSRAQIQGTQTFQTDSNSCPYINGANHMGSIYAEAWRDNYSILVIILHQLAGEKFQEVIDNLKSVSQLAQELIDSGTMTNFNDILHILVKGDTIQIPTSNQIIQVLQNHIINGF